MSTGDNVDGSGRTTWPTARDYQNALQLVETEGTEGLAAGLGFQHGPVDLEMFPGAAGYVFHAMRGKKQYAFKVFNKDVPRRRERYRAIHNHLKANRSRIFIDFQFCDRGVWVPFDTESASWFPAMRMQWCGGRALDVAVKEAVRDGYDAVKWAHGWLGVLGELRRTKVAHGDLQHANVIVGSTSGMRLIDYDGMFVPSMRGLDAIEFGHPAYQHPKRLREGAPFDEHIDGVSGLVILLSLGGLTRELWRKRDEEGLLLGSKDLVAPEKSDLLAQLEKSPEPAARLVELLRQALARSVGPWPELDEAAGWYGVTLPPVASRTTAPRGPRSTPVKRKRAPSAGDGRSIPGWAAELQAGRRAPSREREPRTEEPVWPRTRLQLLTLLSASARLSAAGIAELRGTGVAAAGRQLADVANRLDGADPDAVLGFRLTRRQAQVVELRAAGKTEFASAKLLGIQRDTVRAHLAKAVARIEELQLPQAAELAAEMRAKLDADKARAAREKRTRLAPPREIWPPDRRAYVGREDLQSDGAFNGPPNGKSRAALKAFAAVMAIAVLVLLLWFLLR